MECLTGPFRSCSTEFQAAPLPPVLRPGRPGGGRSQGARGRTGPGLPARGAEPLLPVPPLHLGFCPGRCYNFLAFSPAVSPPAPRPAQPVPPSPSPLGSCPPPCGEPDCSQDSGGARGRAGGWRVGRRRKGKQRREKLGGGRNRGLIGRGESEDGGEHFLEAATPRLRLARLSWGRGSEGGAGRARGQREAALRGPDLPRAPRCGRAGPPSGPDPTSGLPPGPLNELAASRRASRPLCGPCALGARGGEAPGTLCAGTRGPAWRCTPSLASRWSACSASATCPGTGPSRVWWLTGLGRPVWSLRPLHPSLPISSSSSPTTRATTTWATTAPISRPLHWTGWQPRVSSWRIIIFSPSARLRGANFSLAGRYAPGCWDWPRVPQINPACRFPLLSQKPPPPIPNPSGTWETRTPPILSPVALCDHYLSPLPSLGLSFSNCTLNGWDHL